MQHQKICMYVPIWRSLQLSKKMFQLKIKNASRFLRCYQFRVCKAHCMYSCIMLCQQRHTHMYVYQIYFFRQITTFIKVRMAFVFGLQTLSLIEFTKIYRLKGLKPKNKGRTNFYECCDLTKKVYLSSICLYCRKKYSNYCHYMYTANMI